MWGGCRVQIIFNQIYTPLNLCSCIGSIGRVVCVEVTDKKQTKTKENWFPGLVVAPNAQVKKKTNDVPKTLW